VLAVPAEVENGGSFSVVLGRAGDLELVAGD